MFEESALSTPGRDPMVDSMRSLREILSAHAPVLLLDAAGVAVHAGWLEENAPARWSSVREDAGTGIFHALNVLKVPLEQARAFVYCEGPGSILGIRTSAVAIRTWQVLRPRPVFAFRSLELLAVARAQPGLTVIADARRQQWHALTIGADGKPGPMRRLPPEQLQPPLVMPADFRHWSALPQQPVESVPYDLQALWDASIDAPLLREVAEPEAFLHEPPEYVTWTPRIHQAPQSQGDTRTA